MPVRFRHPVRDTVKTTCLLALGAAGALLLAASPSARAQRSQPAPTTAHGEVGPGVPALWVRPGYRVTLAADNIPGARFLAFDDRGTLYVSRSGPGDILALTHPDRNGRYRDRTTFTSGKPSVHGMCFADGWLWYAQSGAIWKARGVDGKAADEQAVIPDGQLPKGGGHWWRPILVTKDALYTGIGDDGNINDHSAPDDPREKIFRYNKDGSGKTLFVSGIRNTEKLLLRPDTDEIWGADHGSDWQGAPYGDRQGHQPVTDWNPPCEFNHYEEGKFYGHPFVVGNVMPRLEFKDRPDLNEIAARTVPPAWPLGPHWAPNGFTFLSKDYFPGHRGDAFIACHGSWNSSKRVGYRVERVLFDRVTGDPIGSLMIVGTLTPDGSDTLDRPVDCVEAPDGTVLFSSDQTGRIYRISYVGKR